MFSRANLARGVGRGAQWSRSRDLIHWSEFSPVQMQWEGGTLGDEEQFYIFGVSPMPSAPHLLLANPLRASIRGEQGSRIDCFNCFFFFFFLSFFPSCVLLYF